MTQSDSRNIFCVTLSTIYCIPDHPPPSRYYSIPLEITGLAIKYALKDVSTS